MRAEALVVPIPIIPIRIGIQTYRTIDDVASRNQSEREGSPTYVARGKRYLLPRVLFGKRTATMVLMKRTSPASGWKGLREDHEVEAARIRRGPLGWFDRMRVRRMEKRQMRNGGPAIERLGTEEFWSRAAAGSRVPTATDAASPADETPQDDAPASPATADGTARPRAITATTSRARAAAASRAAANARAASPSSGGRSRGGNRYNGTISRDNAMLLQRMR